MKRLIENLTLFAGVLIGLTLIVAQAAIPFAVLWILYLWIVGPGSGGL